MLRHGEVHNPGKVVYERLPGFHLSKRGIEMAEGMAKFITRHESLSNIRHIYSSPLERTMETAEPISQALNLQIGTDERLLEARNKFAGLTNAGVIGDIFKNKHFNYILNPFEPSWGESYLTISKRMTSAIEELKNRYKNEQVLLVSHQLPIFIARRTYEKRHFWHNPRRRACAVASLTSLVFSAENGDLLKVLYRVPWVSGKRQ
jgi:broad specificity phosphatase PhoE